MDVVKSAVRGSSVADLVWLDDAGDPHSCAVFALLRNGKPVVALTYAYRELAARIAASRTACLVFTETRSTGDGFTPIALHGTVRLIEDPEGVIFSEELLEQEVRRYPPARIFSGSLLQRREHWWYQPRLILEFDIAAGTPLQARVHPPAEETFPQTAFRTAAGRSPYLLSVAVGQRLKHHVVTVQDDGISETLILTTSSGEKNLPSGRAVLSGQDASFPDLSQWESWSFHGHLEEDRFRITRRPSRIGIGPVPNVWQRWRDQRKLAQSCRRGLAAAGGTRSV